MDFEPSERVKPILAAIEKFVADHVVPAEHEVFERGFAEAAPLLEDLRARCKAAKLWGPRLPKELGGLGLDLVEDGLVSERLGWSPLGHYTFNAQAPDAG